MIYGYVEYNAVLHYLYEFDQRQNGFAMRANEWNKCGTNGESVVESSRAQKAKGNYFRMEIIIRIIKRLFRNGIFWIEFVAESDSIPDLNREETEENTAPKMLNPFLVLSLCDIIWLNLCVLEFLFAGDKRNKKPSIIDIFRQNRNEFN